MTIDCRLFHRIHHFEVRNQLLCMRCDRNLIQLLVDTANGESDAPFEQNQRRETQSQEVPIKIPADYYRDEVNTR